MTYGYCVYHERECDYKGSCIDCPHNTEEDAEWFKQDEERTESEGKRMNFDIEEVLALLAEYIEKHPLAVECGGEYIMQDDNAQVDALKLVCDIFDNI
jgi:hypothetical protein